MYKDFFGLRELPFSIVPSSRFIFLSTRHREAMNHLQSGLGSGGGFALLTGEVGTGKTTVSKALLLNLETNVQPGLLLNPTYTSNELLEAICDEFSIEYPENASLKQLTQAIHAYLLKNHAQGIQTLVLIDEAQHLSANVLEQLRLLTNLETDSQKLLKVLLIGQPELQHKLQTEELRQLAQRITGRYHILPLSPAEVSQYIEFRLQVAGAQYAIFSPKALKLIAERTLGVPRLINLVCDKSLQYAFYSVSKEVTLSIAEKAIDDVMVFQAPVQLTQNEAIEAKPSRFSHVAPYLLMLLIGSALAVSAYIYVPKLLQASTSTSLNKQPIAVDDAAFVKNKTNLNASNALPVNQVAAKDNSNLVNKNQVQEVIANTQSNDFSQINNSLEPYISLSQDRTLSMQVLFKIWGYKAALLESTCLNAKRANLSCFEASGSMSDLLLLNRPAILSFYQQQQAYFAVLFNVTKTHAQLLISGKRLEVPLAWVDKYWSGEFLILWHSDISTSNLKRGAQGPQVAKLDQDLSQALQEPIQASQSYNAQVERKVKAFQMLQGINVDGIAGQQTLMLLDSYTNKNAPMLKTQQGEIR